MKKQTKKFILGLGAVALLTNSLHANMNEEKTQMQKAMMIKHFQIKHMPMKSQKGIVDRMIIGKIMMLDLSDEQKGKIDTIIKEFKAELSDPYEAFSDNEFDKDAFVKAQRNNIKTMIKNRADLIEKVYNVLTKEQRKDLKTILDMDKIVKKKLFNKHQAHKPKFQG